MNVHLILFGDLDRLASITSAKNSHFVSKIKLF